MFLLKGGRKAVQEAASAITFLVSDEAKFETGLKLILDGGVSHSKGGDPELLQIKLAEWKA